MTPGTISSARPRLTWRVALLLVAALFLGFFGASLLSSALLFDGSQIPAAARPYR